MRSVRRAPGSTRGLHLEPRSPWTERPRLRTAAWSALLIAATPAAADTCRFDAECFETEACAEADWTLDLDGETVSTEFGDLSIAWSEGPMILASGLGMVVLLDRGEDGAARASVHMDGPVVVTYHGTCEEAR